MKFEDAHALNEAIRAIAMRHRALAGSLLAPLGLHAGQEVLLLELGRRGPCSQAQLATASGCEAPTITNSVRRLEAAGLVVRHPSPTDGRVTVVRLSERGEALLPELHKAWQRLAELTVAALADTSPDHLRSVLDELATSLAATEDGQGRT